MRKSAYILLTSLVVLLSVTGYTQGSPEYVFEKSIPLPGNGGYDYLFLDQRAKRLYVSHGTTVEVIDLATESLIGTVNGMQGNHGITTVAEVNKGFISDGKANALTVFDLNSFKVVSTIPLSGKKPDAIMYDPYSKEVFAFNGGSSNISVIDIQSLKEVAVIPLIGGPEFAVSDGQGKIYNNIEDKNSLAVIDTKTLKVVTNYPLSPCGGPTGLAYDATNRRLFTVCRENKGMSVVDANSGKVIATIPIGAGVDAVAYDPQTRLIFCSNGDGTLTIIKQESADAYSLLQTVATQQRAKTMALDLSTHKIYLSVVDFEKGTRNAIPGSFKVLVYKMKSSSL